MINENNTIGDPFEQLAVAVMSNIVNNRETIERFGAIVGEIAADLMTMADTPEFRRIVENFAREQAALMPPAILGMSCLRNTTREVKG